MVNTTRLFGTSGIRGIVGVELSVDLCNRVGMAITTTLPPASTVCVATDTRTSRNTIKEAVSSGLRSTGTNVVDLGILPTPALALLTREMGFTTGIMITASHNPPQFNGIKLFTTDALGYSYDQEGEIERVLTDERFRRGERGSLRQAPEARQTYFSFIKGKFSGQGFDHRLRIVVDPGNGAASGFASELFRQMGLDVIPLNDEPDGTFPGRSPEPKQDTLQGTVAFLRQHNADLAICFDGDADRVVFCDREGFLGFNEPIAFISRLAVKKTGKQRVATTVETGHLLDLAVRDVGAEVVRGRVGDVPVAHLVQEIDAALGVEQVGVYIMPEAGYYPDSIFASLFLLSRISDAAEIRRFFDDMPGLYFEKARIGCANELKEPVMARVGEGAQHIFPDEGPLEIGSLDGLRLEFADAWVLIRASGTEPIIRVIAESTSQARTGDLIGKGSDFVAGLVEGIR
jgi:phosphoglucosamine mutase